MSYDPHTRRGRKQTTEDAPSHKAALNREAQRNLRLRKQKYLADLEAKVVELTKALEATAQEESLLKRRNKVLEVENETLRRLSNFPHLQPDAACPSCAAERIKAEVCMEQIYSLEQKVEALQLNPPPMRLQASPLVADNCLLTIPNDPFMYDVQSPFSTGSQSVSEAFATPSSDMVDIENDDAILVNPATGKIACSEELYGPIEIESSKILLKALSSFKFDPERIDHKLCEPREETKREIAARPIHNLEPDVLRFQQTLKAIPSFSESGAVIDQLCSFWVYDCDAEGFFHLNYLMYLLERTCKDVEDRMTFWVAFEVARAKWNRVDMDELISKVEATSL
ncbi:hypothetical protein HDU98_006839 [Podochytrium sp. JEL0797]|nr:hypothetical protein HDU98_006839 [Podochytrium sp. JEL0797]